MKTIRADMAFTKKMLKKNRQKQDIRSKEQERKKFLTQIMLRAYFLGSGYLEGGFQR